MKKLKTLFQFLRRSILWIIFWTTILLYILSFASAYLPPKTWWWLSLLSFGFPLLMLTLVILIPILWWRKKKKSVVTAILALLLSYPLAHKVVGTAFFSKNTKGNFSVLSWNVARFGYGQGFNIKFPPNRAEIVQTLGKLNPDVMCLQEYWYIDSLHHKYNHLEFMTDSMHYPYHMFTNDFTWSGSGALYGGNIIFSKYPIVKTGQEKLFSIGKTEDIGIADIAINLDTLRFFTYHLRSNKLSAAEVKTIDGNDKKALENNSTDVGKTILKKLRSGAIDRAEQAAALHKVIAQSPYPVISTGDFNDIPNSYSYRIASQGLKDVFLEKGVGWGRTYTGISPTLRIDYTMHSPSLICNSFERIRYPQSDHYALLSSFTVGK
jgi:endonuclease/exonuclease/phosphatase family metal-dependent hydrolase